MSTATCHCIFDVLRYYIRSYLFFLHGCFSFLCRAELYKKKGDLTAAIFNYSQVTSRFLLMAYIENYIIFCNEIFNMLELKEQELHLTIYRNCLSSKLTG